MATAYTPLSERTLPPRLQAAVTNSARWRLYMATGVAFVAAAAIALLFLNSFMTHKLYDFDRSSKCVNRLNTCEAIFERSVGGRSVCVTEGYYPDGTTCTPSVCFKIGYGNDTTTPLTGQCQSGFCMPTVGNGAGMCDSDSDCPDLNVTSLDGSQNLANEVHCDPEHTCYYTVAVGQGITPIDSSDPGWVGTAQLSKCIDLMKNTTFDGCLETDSAAITGSLSCVYYFKYGTPTFGGV